MVMSWYRVGICAVLVTLGSVVISSGWLQAQPRTLKEFGEPVYPAFEGWYQNPDGTFSLLVGYFNPNKSQTVMIPIGEDNFISPGPQDQGQPTHFSPGRAWGLFTIQVPADFGTKRLTWTVTANGQTVEIPFHLDPLYVVEPFKDAANNNEPPIIRFAPGGEERQGPPVGLAASLDAEVGDPLELRVWTSDVKPDTHARQNQRRRRPALVLRWHQLRGPGEVEFAEPRQEFEESSDQNPTTTATFPEPGEYLLRVEALDESGEGGGGFQCCWTSAHVRVSVS